MFLLKNIFARVNNDCADDLRTSVEKYKLYKIFTMKGSWIW